MRRHGAAADDAPRTLSAILDAIASEALASGDHPVLDLTEEAHELLEASAAAADGRERPSGTALDDVVAALILDRRRHASSGGDAPPLTSSREALARALRAPEIDLDGALEMFLGRLEERLEHPAGPAQDAFESTAIIWSPWDANGIELEDLAREATRGDAICTYWQVRRAPLAQAPQAARSFFGVEEDEPDD